MDFDKFINDYYLCMSIDIKIIINMVVDEVIYFFG